MKHFERLHAVDAAFLTIESAGVHMQVGSVLVFDGGPLLSPEGGIDAARIRAAVGAVLHRIPRWRQRLDRVPLEGHPIWVDDERFDLDYHVRHVSLARPGDERALKRMAGWLLSQPLDHRRPLWEMWIVEGLEGGRFAVIAKVHHCMIDGVGGIGVLAMLLRGDESPEMPEPKPWRARPAPRPAALLADALRTRARAPFALVAAARRAAAQPWRALEGAWTGAVGLTETLADALRLAPATSLNPDHVGPHRRFDWLRIEMERIDALKRRTGTKLNDVALAIAAGGLHRFLRGRRERNVPEMLRTLVPVSVRREGEGPEAANRVALVVAELPLGRMSPLQRLRRISEEMRRMKGGGRVRGTELVEEISERFAPRLVGQAVWLAARRRAFHLVVTNVPGPRRPLYLLGAQLLEAYPVVPLFESQALGIALLSYDGSLHIGVNADRDGFPDLHDVVGCLAAEFEELCKASAEGEAQRGADQNW